MSSPLPAPRMDPTLLRRFELFRNISDKDARIMSKAFDREVWRVGDRIFSEGDAGDKLYLVETGAVRISQPLGGFREEALAVVRTGEFFGDMSLIDARPRSAHAIAHEDCVLWAIQRGVFITILRLNSELAIDVLFQFMLSLSTRLRENNEKIRAMNLMAMW